MSDENPVHHVHRRAASRPLDLSGLVGIRYKDGGRDRREGLDCWGLARIVLARMDLKLPEDPAEALAGESTLGDVVTGALRAGDVLVIRTDEGQHVGVAIDPFQFIHTTRHSGSVIGRIEVVERAGRVLRRVRLRPPAGAAA